MPFIAFLGCDGSGKSAVIAAITRMVRAEGLEVTHGHWRPVALSTAASEPAVGNAEDPHGQKPRGAAASIAKLGWLGLNWWLGWFRFLRGKARAGLVIFDRYHADLLVDPVRYRYGGPMGLAHLASRLMPQPDLVVFLDAPPEVLLSRKQEVPLEALKKSRAAYLELARRESRIQVIDAARPLDAVVGEVFERIMAIR
jgi:thymidylate kinase